MSKVNLKPKLSQQGLKSQHRYQQNFETKTFDFSLVCRLCAERNVRLDTSKAGPSLVGTGTYFKAWDALLLWIQMQQQSSKAVNLPQFGIVGYIIGNEQKQMYLRLSDQFLFKQGLHLDLAKTGEIEQIGKTVIAPTVKVNLTEVAKIMGGYGDERAQIHTCLNTIFQVIGSLLSQSNNAMVHIDLGLLGIISAINQAVFVVPFQKRKAQIHTHHKGKQTVMELMKISQAARQSQAEAETPRNMMQRVESHPELARASMSGTLHSARRELGGSQSVATFKGQLPSINHPQSTLDQEKPFGTASAADSYNLLAANRLKHHHVSQKSNASQMRSSIRSLLRNSQLFQKKDSPTRRVLQKDDQKSQVGNQFLGAGQDTLTKDQDFSQIKPSLLLSKSFKKPNNSLLRFPPVLDFFSRTLAAPISSQKYYFSLSHRIASNYTPSLRGVYYDTRLRQILYKSLHSHSKATLSIIDSSSVIPATDEQQYKNYMRYIKIDDRKLKEKANSFKRYMRYIQSQIPDDVLSPIKEAWTQGILLRTVIKTNQTVLDSQVIQIMVDSMLNEVNDDYKLAIKKSIMDYILLDQYERGRLGVQKVVDSVPQWGTATFIGVAQQSAKQKFKELKDKFKDGKIKVTQEEEEQILTLQKPSPNPWHDGIEQSRDNILQTLCIYTPSMLRFKVCWEKFKQLNFLRLPRRLQPPMTLPDFITTQERQMSHTKNILVNTWVQECSQILRQEVQSLEPEQVTIFSQAVATLMSIQLRYLVQKSIEGYVQFMRRFHKPRGEYRFPIEVIARSKDKFIPEEDAFILLHLKRDQTDIKFTESLHIVRNELVGIIQKILNQSQNIIRPDNQSTNSEKTHLWSVPADSKLVISATEQVEDILQGNLDAVQRVLQLYTEYKFIFSDKHKIEQFVSERLRKSMEQYKGQIKSFEDLIDSVRLNLPFDVRMSAFVVSCSDVNDHLINQCQQYYIETLMKAIAQNIISEDCNRIKEEFDRIKSAISVKIDSAQRCIEVQSAIQNARLQNIPRLSGQYVIVKQWLQLLHSVQHIFPSTSSSLNKVVRGVSDVHKRVCQIDQILEHYQNQMKNERIKQENQLIKERRRLNEQMDEIHGEVQKFRDIQVPSQRDPQNPNQMIYNYKLLANLREQLQTCISDADMINTRESVLGFIVTEFPKLQVINSNLKPYQRLWILYRDSKSKLEHWKATCLFDLNGEEIVKQRKVMMRQATELKYIFGKSKPKPMRVLENGILKHLQEFQNYQPILLSLLTQGFKPRHWKQLAQSTKIPLQPPPSNAQQRQRLNLTHYISLQLHQKPKQLEDVAEKAAKQYANEKILDKIEKQWQPMRFELKSWRGETTLILGGQCVEDMQTLLDEHILKVQTMKGSPYAKVFQKQIAQWEQWFLRGQDILDVWTKVQSNWLYLKPVFSSQDIMKQMPSQGAQFAEVDRAWHNLMKQVDKDPRSMKVLSIPNILQQLQLCYSKLEQVQKGLNQYLETKQAAFPRFYFLSNQELLQILSETKDPLRVQKHINKCFQGINKLMFDSQKVIHGMYSKEQEGIKFLSTIDPSQAKDKVEYWLNELEVAMIRAVRDISSKSSIDYSLKKREQWVLDWPGQAVLAGNMKNWTEVTEDYIIKSGNKGLQEYSGKLNEQLKNIVQLVRGDLTKLNRCTLQALIVLDVHNKDVIAQMAQTNVSDISDFKWQSQLRYYWMDNELNVKIINATLEYNYEYIGNSSRLVITPLTDRCYRTLCGAVHLNYGGAPEGPAGTGKTETVKDLAKALARYCMVFNCSEGLDHLSMAKFFKGLASCGAWSCFDEFNRIDLEVLSVVAQQLMSIQQGVARKSPQILFQGTTIKLKFTCSCFITMNPGYAGRSQLPDNLKALFRTVAMMVPDYAMIAEITLYSFGFLNARVLAGKIATTYKLCSEQLSSQDHYDYGMRAVKSVLTAAGNLKHKFPNDDEQQLMLRAINDVNLAKFLSHDLPLFQGISSDLFPGVELPKPDYDELQTALRNQLTKKQLQEHPYLMHKIIQLYEMIVVRHGLMVVGRSFSGKSTSIHVLAAALTQLAQNKNGGQMQERLVHTKTVYPKAITMGQLYGKFDDVSHDWHDGVLAVWFRFFADTQDQSNDRKWLIFDGPVDALWIENMNTVLDDNKKLCLNSGEIIKMTDNMNLIFQAMDLAAASPATVSRCGMVYMEPHQMGWRPIYNSWKEKLPLNVYNEELMKNIQALIDLFIDPLLAFLRKQLNEQTQTQNQSLVTSMLRLFRILLKEIDGGDQSQALYLNRKGSMIGQTSKVPQQQQMQQKQQSLKIGGGGADNQTNLISDRGSTAGLTEAPPPCLLATMYADEKRTAIEMVNACFLFAITWGICGSISSQDRKKMDLFCKRLQRGDVPDEYMHLIAQSSGKKTRVTGSCPDRGTMYDYCYDPSQQRWWHWNENIQKADKIPNKAIVSEIIIQTIDTVRYSNLLQKFIEASIPSLFVGPTGTGKSLYVKQTLYGRPADQQALYLNIEVGFSAQTSANQTQDIIDSKLDKRKKDHFGPKYGQKCIIFVDDMNMPKKQIYGAQPPLELLRQFLDKGCWYDYQDKKHPLRHIIDTTLIGAMGSPSGGRTQISPRVQRHFNIIAIANFDDQTMTRIFRSILQWYLTKNNFSPEVIRIEDKLVAGTMEIYKRVAADLLPTPLRSHYTFNLRDFAKVIFGICLSNKNDMANRQIATRLWMHECVRVFGDRLINDEDRTWLMNAIRTTTTKVFGVNFDSILKHLDLDGDQKILTLDQFRCLMFSDIMGPMGMPNRPYVEITDQVQLQEAVQQSLEQYNEMSEKPMDLVLFKFAIQHLLRISRILKQPGGNALLVGVGGSGRQSLTRLSSRLSDCHVCQIEISKGYGMNEWRDDLKTFLKLAGGNGEGTVFLFTDIQIKMQGFLQDINNLLNSGEVPNIYAPDEKVEVCQLVRQAARAQGKEDEGSPAEMFKYFIQRCKKSLHIVLCFSPIGQGFRNRIRSFPSLVNCCTIDWFSQWPDDALKSVAQTFLGAKKEVVEENDALSSNNQPARPISGESASPVKQDKSKKNEGKSAMQGEKEEVIAKCVEMCQYFHKSTKKAALDYQKDQRRIYYVTATSYLQLIQTFNALLKEKKDFVRNLRDRYENGYDCLIKTQASVQQMQIDLQQLKPKLAKSQADTEQKMQRVEIQSVQVDKKRQVVGAEEAIANKAAEEAQALRQDCQADLNKALPQLRKAEQALQCIDRQKIATLKNQMSPPDDARMVLAAVCVLQGVPPDRKLDTNTGKTTFDYWRPAVGMMTKADFLKSLVEYDRENIDPKRIEGLKKYISEPHFNPKYLSSVSQVASSLAQWVISMDRFYHVTLQVRPKEQKLKFAKAKQKQAEERLFEKKADLKVVVDRMEKLNFELKETQENSQNLQRAMQNCKVKLERARKLINGLGGEKTRWFDKTRDLTNIYEHLVGDVLVSAGIIAYLGAFGALQRNNVIKDWVSRCQELQIPSSSQEFSIQKVLGDAVIIRAWSLAGLPSDDFSIENGIIINKSQRWTLNIDPQGQANKWLKNFQKKQRLSIIKFSDKNYLKILQAAVQFGNPVLLENVGQQLEPSIDGLLYKRIYKKGRSLNLKLGDTIVEYSPNFRFYITTKLRNPHYMPQVSTAVTLINFGITYQGLRDQLLSIVVAKQRPQLETEKQRLINESAKNKDQLAANQDKILNKITTTGSKILDDSEAIQFLSEAKKLADEVMRKQLAAEQTQKGIDEARLAYKPVAQKAAALFFCISDLAAIDPMYQYSLNFYIQLFNLSIQGSKTEEQIQVEQRLQNLRTYFLSALYRNVCRSLFEKDKLIFSFLLCIKLMEQEDQINMEQVRFLLTGGVSLGEEIPQNPYSSWLSQSSWAEIHRLSHIKGSSFEGFANGFSLNHKKFQAIFDAAAPHQMTLPAPYNSSLTPFQRLIIMRILRPDKVVPALQDFVSNKMGKQFILPPEFDLSIIYKDSTSTSPLIFVLSPGSDPLNVLMKFADQKKKILSTVSLGKGQGDYAKAQISQAVQRGSWVVLQNCHLAVSWLPELQAICENLSPDPRQTHREFRLWLTSYPSNSFPVSILQGGIKMTNQAPKGLRNNLVRSLASDPLNDAQFFDMGVPSHLKDFHKLLFSLCFFHAVVQERRQFGALGWNIPYQFSDNDLKISALQLQMFLNQMQGNNIPFNALCYLTGECNYGGRVTQDNDRRLIITLLDNFWTKKALTQKYRFSKAEQYYIPPAGTRESYLQYIRNLPTSTDPQVFGFHPNADITRQKNQTNMLFNAILSTMSGAAGGTKKKKKDQQEEKKNQSENKEEDEDEQDNSGDKQIITMSQRILQDIPQPFDIEKARKKYKVDYAECMNTVLTQEMVRYNGLINTVRGSLENLIGAIGGMILMTTELEQTSKSMIDGKIPQLWLKKSYPSLKPLGSYIKDLKERLDFFQQWFEKGIPGLFWINKFFFTHGFLTGALQNYARKITMAIDRLDFDFEVIYQQDPLPPASGINVTGLFIQGARFDRKEMQLTDSLPKVLYEKCPILWFKPCLREDISSAPAYLCPLYKTSQRRGTLTTTGHSSNFIKMIRLPSKKPESYWIMRGVALLTMLDD